MLLVAICLKYQLFHKPRSPKRLDIFMFSTLSPLIISPINTISFTNVASEQLQNEDVFFTFRSYNKVSKLYAFKICNLFLGDPL